MSDIRCPYCRKDNPDFLDNCYYCSAPLITPKIGKSPINDGSIGEINDTNQQATDLNNKKVPFPMISENMMKSPITPTNPYIAGNPVGDSHAFIGREDILFAVRRVLKDPNQNAITLFGQRRIGKTSLLQYLENQLPQEGSYRTVYFDLQDRAAKSLEDVLVELAQTIAGRLNLIDPNFEENPRQNFHNIWLPNVLRGMPTGKSLVLLFDEFDVLADPRGGQAARDFFPYLRTLLALDRQRLQFVFVLGRNIGDLNQIALSLLKGVPDRRVSLFDREETTALVKLSEQNDTLHWEAEGIQTVWELTNGHPYLTQAICWEVWERIYDRSSSSPAFVKSDDVIAVVDKTLEKSRNTLEWLWGGLGPAEKVVSAALAQADSPLVTDADLETILSESGVRVLIRELREAPQLLQDWDLLEPAQGGYRFRVELLRRWIIRYHPLNLVQKELDTINPAAESLYQAAYSLYQGANLQQATPLLQQSLALNPNHRRAAELLSEIYLAEGNLDKAETLLNGLLDLYPATARPRLVQIYLRNSEETEDEDKKLVYYEKALTISPQHPVALSGKQYIWTMRGEKAIKEIRWEDALHAFKQAELIEKIEWVRQKIAEEAISSGLLVFEQFEHNKDYKKAFQQATALIEKYPESRTRLPTLDILEAKSLLTPKYHQALGALQQGDRDQSIRLLLEIMELEPTYRDVTRYLHLAITGEDINILAEENKHLNEFVKYWLPLPVVRIQLLRTIVAPQIRLINIFRQRAEELKKINKTDDIT